MNLETLEEQNTLGAIMLTPIAELPDVIHSLQPEFFSDPDHANIWMAMQDLISLGIDPDEVSICSKLKEWEHRGLEAKVCELAANTMTTINLAHWAGIVLRDGKRQDAKRSIGRILDQAKAGSVGDMQTALGAALEAIRDDGESGGLRPIKEILPAVLKDIQAREQDPNIFRICKTGIWGLDKAVELRAGQMTILAGRPGMGKSALACNIAAQVSTKKTVALFSLEMSAESLLQRMMKARGGSDIGGMLHIDDRSAIRPAEVFAGLKKLKAPALVIVDYLQLVKADEKLERQDLRVGSVTKALRAIAKDLGCHMLVLAQLNRQVESRESKRPILSDLRDSGAIEEDSDNVWFIHRPGYYNPEDGPDSEIIIAKNRFGETGFVEVVWDGKRQTFLGEPS
jgi:replicative DNA helicase